MHLPLGGGLVVTALVLGVTHGLEPDHVAGITALTQDAASPKLSALVGGIFGFGHAVLVAVWIVVAYVLLDTTNFPAHLEQFGLLIVAITLAVLSLYLGVTGLRRLVHRHPHEHGSDRHAHYHLHLPFVDRSEGHADAPDGHVAHDHEHTVGEYLKIGVVGALFTLSPPVSMLAFISVTMADNTPGLIGGVLAVYTVAIVATLAVVGAGAGTVVTVLKDRGERIHATFQVLVSTVVLVIAVDLLSQSVGVVPGV